MARVVLLVTLLVALGAAPLHASPNWAGDYPPCLRQGDLLNSGAIDLGVRFLTSNQVLANQFARALDFWSTVLDVRWHKVETGDCSIEVVDGGAELFASNESCNCTSARSQFPDEPNFQGWVAFNPALRLTAQETFRISVHELGHLFGLRHNASASSVMYFFDLDEPIFLDGADLRALAVKHRLRDGIAGESGFPISR